MIRDLLGFFRDGSGLTPGETPIAILIVIAILAMVVTLIFAVLDRWETRRQRKLDAGRPEPWTLGPAVPDEDDYLGSNRRRLSGVRGTALQEPDHFSGPVLVGPRRRR